jgi:DNA-binding NarL/FixJ family response regulator
MPAAASEALGVDPTGGPRYRAGPNIRDTPSLAVAMTPTTLASPKSSSHAAAPTVPLGTLPSRLRLLFVTTVHRRGAWLAEAFAADSAVQVELDEAVGMASGLARLREEAFDAVLVSHEPGTLDALDLAEALRGGGSAEPLVLLGQQSEQEMSPLAFEAGADGYVCINTTTTRSLIWLVARAVERHRLIRENRRLSHAEQHRLSSEHRETQRLLEEQRSLLRELETAGDVHAHADCANGSSGYAKSLRPQANLNLPPSLVAHYHELVRAYVIMGSGNLGDDMARVAELMADAGITAPETMQLHVCVVEEMVRGLGARSARHVMTRADLLMLEVMAHLSEVYRKRYFARRNPPQQLALPGFEGIVLPPAPFADPTES